MSKNYSSEYYYRSEIKSTPVEPCMNQFPQSPKPSNPPQPPERFVEVLRQRGIKVRVAHYRWVADPAAPWPGFELARVSKYARKSLRYRPEIGQNGGETHVTVQLPDGREAQGVAVCSTADLYNKRLGVYLAAKRALATLKVEKPTLKIGPPAVS